jgi:hypothetical protein
MNIRSRPAPTLPAHAPVSRVIELIRSCRSEVDRCLRFAEQSPGVPNWWLEPGTAEVRASVRAGGHVVVGTAPGIRADQLRSQNRRELRAVVPERTGVSGF